MIDQNQDLLVRFPNLGSDDVIIPGMANLSFNIELTSTADPNRTLVSNIGRAIIKKLAVKFEGNEILSIDNYDVFACYQDLWKTKSEKKNAIREGIISTKGDLTLNYMKLRIMLEINVLLPPKIKLLQMHMETNSSSFSTLKCKTAPCPITKQDSETD